MFDVAETTAIIADSCAGAVDGSFWVTGTLAQWRRGRAWASGELVAYAGDGTTVTSRIGIGVTGKHAAGIERGAIEAGIPIRAGLTVEALCTIDYHPVWGLRLVVTRLVPTQRHSPSAASRSDVGQMIADQHLAERQRSLASPSTAHHLGVIVPRAGDAAHADVMVTLRAAFGDSWACRQLRVPMVGPASATAITHAIHKLRDCPAILVVRGGGPTSDLTVWNSQSVITTVAVSPTPVIVGIGHATDNPLVNQVAHHAAVTPSAAAQWIVQCVGPLTRPALGSPVAATNAIRRSAPVGGVCASRGWSGVNVALVAIVVVLAVGLALVLATA